MRKLQQIQRKEQCGLNKALEIQESERLSDSSLSADSASVVKLNDGDGLRILPETEEFSFQCCDCGLIHDIAVEHDERGIVLKFKRREVCISCGSTKTKMAHEGSYYCDECENHFMPNKQDHLPAGLGASVKQGESK